jgi:uncharacterized protein YcbK (DUF882 family)
MKLTANFSLSEFRCNDPKGTNVPKEYIANCQELATNLQVLRDYLGEPLQLNCGYRTPVHNKKVGGEPNSLHLKAMAADIVSKSKSPKELADIIEKLIAEKKMKQGGLGRYPGFTHYDIRGVKARWGK